MYLTAGYNLRSRLLSDKKQNKLGRAIKDGYIKIKNRAILDRISKCVTT
jgi:hypothetical protein